jgi:peptidoglycan hydrolase-like protein with peptidoglycan-binding domain
VIRRRLAAVALVALSLAGCGGGEEEDAAGVATGLDLATTGSLETALPETTSAPVVVPVPEPGRPIGPTSRGSDVKALQEALLELGFKPGKADGFFGVRTRKAVIAFQREHGLRADGLVGPKTAQAINEALAAAG